MGAGSAFDLLELLCTVYSWVSPKFLTCSVLVVAVLRSCLLACPLSVERCGLLSTNLAGWAAATSAAQTVGAGWRGRLETALGHQLPHAGSAAAAGINCVLAQQMDTGMWQVLSRVYWCMLSN